MNTSPVVLVPRTTESVPDGQEAVPGMPKVKRHAHSVPAGVQNRRDWLAASIMLLTARFLPTPQFREIW